MSKLYFSYAAMNAGKSTVLLQASYNYEERGMQVALFTAAHDERSGRGVIGSRLGLTRGADTFGLSGGTDSVFAARERNLPITCFGVMHQQTPFVFVARANSSIRSLADFRGKTITTWFTGANFVLLGMLAQAGLRPSDFTMQPQQVSVTPFVDGQIDVVTATRYNEMFTLIQRVGRDNLRLFVPDDHGITFPRDTLIAGEQVMRDRPQLVQGFLRASIRGWRDALRRTLLPAHG